MDTSEPPKLHSSQQRRLLTLAMLVMLGGCANDVAPREDMTIGGAKPIADRGRVDCSTTYLVLATVSKCGSGGIKFGVAAE